MNMINLVPFKAALLSVVLAAGLVALSPPAASNAQQSTSPPSQILRQLAAQDVEAALETLGTFVDQAVTFHDLAYSGLPSAAAGLHRSLAQLSADEQYELLERWTLPETGRNRVRLLAIPVPTDAPPKVFARALGERPLDSTFAIASVGPVRGFFCSGWMLVKAADDVGRLARLRTTLEELAKAGVTGSNELLMLAQLAGSRGDLDRVAAYLQSLTDADKANSVDLSPEAMPKAAIASAALLHPELQPIAESLFNKLVDRAGQDDSIALRPFLRIAHATAVQIHRGDSPPEVLFQNKLKYWVAATVRSARDIERGQPSGIWLSHEQHLLHLAGGTTDVLFCRFPLVGEFDFVCETQEGGAIGTDGGLVYGGLHFQALGRNDMLQVWDADGNHEVTRPSPFARHDDQPVFNRVSIQSSAHGANFESNFHPVWFDGEAALSSPWLGLRSSGTKRPVFRNFKLTGKPVIPREVRLSAGDQLRGWQSGFFGETQPSFRTDTINGEKSAAKFDWQMRSGEILSAKLEDQQNAPMPSLLSYQRPLLQGEAIKYQFLHQGDATIVHPAIGRLAFLLESTGVRIRWISTGEAEWTGLKVDNATLEPLNRRGPRPLPLKEDEWNTVAVERLDDKLLLKLNDELIYQRPIDSDGEPQFGLYRPMRISAARVRNIVMTGDWHESVPDDFVTDPLATNASTLNRVETP